MDFALFLLLNVALFLRPQDLFPAVSSIHFYNILIVANLVVALPMIANQVRAGWKRAPAMVCVVGILAALVLSLLARSDFAGAWQWGLDFAKVAAYFVLLTAVITTTRRFTIFLGTLVALTIVLAALSVAHFHGQVDIAAIKHAREVSYDAATGDQIDNLRLAAYGVFADPNDLSMIVVMSMLICLGAIFYRDLKLMRIAMVAPLLFLGYVLALTQSRGGLLALIAGLGVYLVNRYGWMRSSVIFSVVLGGLFVVFEGRQVDISGGISGGTGAQRTDLWYAGLNMLKWSPLVGWGHGQFVQEEGLVAHNSYIQALAEWGFLGGMMFVGLFYIVLHSVWRLKPVRARIASPVLRSMQPYVLGALAAYAASMLTLTRCDVVPTYLVAGLGVSYERLARRGTPLPPLEVNSPLILRVALVTLGFIAATYIYIRYIYRLF